MIRSKRMWKLFFVKLKSVVDEDNIRSSVECINDFMSNDTFLKLLSEQGWTHPPRLGTTAGFEKAQPKIG
jgi:hypothetical protein